MLLDVENVMKMISFCLFVLTLSSSSMCVCKRNIMQQNIIIIQLQIWNAITIFKENIYDNMGGRLIILHLPILFVSLVYSFEYDVEHAFFSASISSCAWNCNKNSTKETSCWPKETTRSCDQFLRHGKVDLLPCVLRFVSFSISCLTLTFFELQYLAKSRRQPVLFMSRALSN